MRVLEEYERQFLAQWGKILLASGEKKQARKNEAQSPRPKSPKGESA